MEDWVKIYSFETQYKAELTRGLLEQNDIKAVVVNAKDSLFLIGAYELYVNSSDEKKAIAIVDEYRGLTKIDSFIMRGPIERLKDVLEDNGIISVIKTCANPRYLLDNYELYVSNDDVTKAVPFVTGEGLKGWTKVNTCIRTRQARFRVEILNSKSIPSIVIKKRDANFMKEEIFIYVKDEDADSASKILTDLDGWVKIGTYDNRALAEIQEKLLGKAGYRCIMVPKDGKMEIYVEGINKDKAVMLLKESKNWKLLVTCTSQVEADYTIALLETAGIGAVSVSRTDLTLAVDVDVYVEDMEIDRASELLKKIASSENE